MGGLLSALPLRALLDEPAFEVVAVVTPAVGALAEPFAVAWPASPQATGTPRRGLPLLGQAGATEAPTLAGLAGAHGLPLIELARLRDGRTLAALAEVAPDLICVSCFARRLPPELLRLARLGALNLHPSLLPANRGPDPLFWTFRLGAQETGVTVHLMDAEFDHGPIVAQERIALADGMSEAALERRCGEVGGALLTRAARALAGGAAQPLPQDEAQATNFGFPTARDYIISPEGSARWAFNFACGVIGRGQPLRIQAAGATFRALAPLGYDADATLDTPWRTEGATLWLRCAPGVFTARVAT